MTTPESQTAAGSHTHCVHGLPLASPCQSCGPERTVSTLQPLTPELRAAADTEAATPITVGASCDHGTPMGQPCLLCDGDKPLTPEQRADAASKDLLGWGYTSTERAIVANRMAREITEAVAAERTRIAAIATEYLSQYTSESKREPATSQEVMSAAKAAAIGAVMDAAGLR